MSTDYDPTETTPLILEGGDNDNDDDEWRDVDMSLHPIPEEETEQWRFPPDTDPSGGEDIPMTTRFPPEKQGASGGTAETSFNEKEPITLENRARKEIQDDFPNADWTQLEVRDRRAPRSGGLVIEIRYHARDKWYDLYTKSAGDTEKTLNQSISKEIKMAL